MSKENYDFLDNSKNQLGKLLATENIRIEHRKVDGPFFDVKQRLLVLPIWKNISEDLYDLMIGHEVGHALFTPTSGWENEVKKKGMGYKTCLNIIEDVRIEKKMRRKFPGLRRPMFNGYSQLLDRNFFGVSPEDMNMLPFADRLNAYFKLGSRAIVTFTPEEQKFVDRVDSAETWNEVTHLADELFQKSGDEIKKMTNMFQDFDENNPDHVKALMDAILEGRVEIVEGNYDGQVISDNLLNILKEMMKDKFPSITEKSMNQNIDKLIDETATEIVYAVHPNFDIKKFVIPAHIVYETMKFSDTITKFGDVWYTNFMSENKAYIAQMVKEFELRRNAKQFSKARLSKTGDLNVDKLWSYQMSEDIFRQSTIVPNGKNHGMIMLVDMSASMGNNMHNTLEQIICLSIFCKKVNIPFEVYGFIDNSAVISEFAKAKIDAYNRNESTEGFLRIDDSTFRLKEFLNNRMNAVQFKSAVKSLIMLAHTYSNHYYAIPSTMRLGSTPLNEAIMVLKSIAETFKKNTKVEILNTIILTDGDATGSPTINDYSEFGNTRYLSFRERCVIRDKNSHITVSSKKSIQLSLLELYKRTTGSRVIGYFLTGSNSIKSEAIKKNIDYNSRGSEDIEKNYPKYLKDKYYPLQCTYGYDTFYIIGSSSLEIEKKVLEEGVDKNVLLKQFKNINKKKRVSRVFVNKFIEQIS